ncbi:unnamed protein product [Lupinus luteus]|uniref:F-box domain-containing protein n=1 Tax=Lupinus luteus TaxID=3873 RepID=A0AAV1VSQ0_LUPLU
MGCESLPEGCIATILSRTTPRDTCILSLVSRTFYSASQSDAVWASFLPSDYISIFSRSVSHSSFLASSPSNKSIYLALSHRPIIIDHATMSFHLERKSGKRCYMLAARALTIIWGDGNTPHYWKWTTLPDSRFPEVAQLVNVCWLEIHGVINTSPLTPNTHYAAYFVFKMIDPEGLRYPVRLSVDISFRQSTVKEVYLYPNLDGWHVDNRMRGLQLPNVRSDGWLEIEMREFFNSGLVDDEVHMSITGTEGSWKRGLVIEGIEVRPKEAN